MITKEEFEEYCRTNNLRYKFKHEDYHEEFVLKYNWNLNNLFCMLCRYGYIETLKWILTLGEINIHENEEKAFITSCDNGHIEVAKLLIEISKERGEIINIHEHDDEAFRWSCMHGYLEIAKWLIEISKENGKINIHADNENAFRLSCSNGKIEVAKWLIEISKENKEMINIHINNEEAFKHSCINGKIEVVKWLCSLYDDYYIEIKNNKIVKYGVKNIYERYM